MWLCPSASAASPLGLTDCGPAQGVYQCSGLVETWDGVPLDTTVTLPSKSSRHLPAVAEIHGFGNSKYEYLDPGSTAYTDNAFAWAKDGYAVLTYTARGLWGSCGTPEARAANPQACARGYIHLADVRYEVRDTQELIGRLVDQGYAAPRIGVTGDSYGGGQSLMLAALRDRVMLPDGRLVPWRSPDGRRLQIAAAAPVIPWSDLVSAAAPNGRVKANGITTRREAQTPIGVEKASFVNAIAAAAQFATGPGQPVGEPFVPGRPMGFLAPAGTDPQADVASWVARTNAGEPYTDPEAQKIVRLLTRYHSPYYIDPSRPPAPLFIASGFTDDLFPVDEALRFANRTRSLYPRSPLSLLFGDFGHQRAANKPAERSELLNRVHGWFDRYLRGRGSPRQGVTAYVADLPALQALRRAVQRPSVRPAGASSGALRGRGTADGLIGRWESGGRRGDRSGHRRRRQLRFDLGRHCPGHGALCLEAPGRFAAHADRSPPASRRPGGERRSTGERPGRRAALGRGARRQLPTAGRPGHLPPGPRKPLAAASRGLAVRAATTPRCSSWSARMPPTRGRRTATSRSRCGTFG